MPRERRTRTDEVEPESTDEATDGTNVLAVTDVLVADAPEPQPAVPEADTPEPVDLIDLEAAPEALAGTAEVEVGAEAGGVEVKEDGVLREAAPTEALPSLIEALLFVSDGPVELKTLARTLGVTMTVLGGAIEELRVQLDGRGLLLQTGPDGAQLITAPHAASYIEALLGIEQQRKLSNAALETLAIIAYRQPVTRATIESIRGVSSDGAMQTLRARGLIEDAGRSQGPGRPTLFATTQRFLEHFGLRSPQDLPDLGDVALPLPDTSIPMPGLDAPADSSSVAAAESEVAANLAALSAAAFGLIHEGAPALLGPGPVRAALAAPVAGVDADAAEVAPADSVAD